MPHGKAPVLRHLRIVIGDDGAEEAVQRNAVILMEPLDCVVEKSQRSLAVNTLLLPEIRLHLHAAPKPQQGLPLPHLHIGAKRLERVVKVMTGRHGEGKGTGGVHLQLQTRLQQKEAGVLVVQDVITIQFDPINHSDTSR